MVRKALVAAAVVAVAAVSVEPATASSMTRVYKVSVACQGQAKFYDTIEAIQASQALQIMKRRYPGCVVYIEGNAKRVSPQH